MGNKKLGQAEKPVKHGKAESGEAGKEENQGKTEKQGKRENQRSRAAEAKKQRKAEKAEKLAITSPRRKKRNGQKKTK